ncbi:ATP-grasp domain-containing protein [Methanosarcina sp. WH1]|uniref:ATP-grasp domain-containing protein n=1 Tax=Methanosarcina sp. WH1 TaxID=1434102 RepID=UPI000615F90A|nr:ATP-grasp domain-containing protein [Methanosarcina sp. WH1]AKB23274.1 ATP-grasp enzyme-like protein [Methanosarcina sp. WH1]
MNILLTSVGRRTYLVKYFKDALNNVGLVYAANSNQTYAMQIADKSICTPLIHDPVYIDYLRGYCLKNEIKAIVPLFDIDLPILANSKKKFNEQGIQVVVSNYETTQICNDKWKTYKFLTSIDIPTPMSFISIKDCLESINNNTICFPLIIKPRWGMGSIGIYQADNLSELEILYQKTKRDILNTYLKYESCVDLESSIIIQEKLLGDEYGLDVFNDLNGNFLTCIPKQKIAMRAGETDSAIIVENKDLFELGENIAIKLKHVANLDVDCFLVKGTYYVLEMNCRFGGQYPFSHLAGANFPKAIINMLRGERVNKELLHAIPGTIGTKNIEPKILNKN